MVPHASKSSIWDAEAEELGAQGQPQLCIKFQVSLFFFRFYLKQNKSSSKLSGRILT